MRNDKGQFVKGLIPWNKGIAVRLNPKGEFQKGFIPWNKGLKKPKPLITKVKVRRPVGTPKHPKGKLCPNCLHIYWKGRNSGIYCSRKCQKESVSKRTKKVIVCINCATSRTVNLSYQAKYFCGDACQREYYIGDKHPSWRGGQDERKSFELTEWRKAVYIRDNYRCHSCSSNKKIEAHHILPFSAFPDLRTHIPNGMTLCATCHDKLLSNTLRKKLILINN